MTGVIPRHCETCGVPFKAETKRFCSRECRAGWTKGGKTYDEKRQDAISDINKRWIDRGSKKRITFDPTQTIITNY